jgi:hypothetical protein
MVGISDRVDGLARPACRSGLMVLVVASDTGHVGDGAEVLEFVGVDDAAHRVDHAVAHFAKYALGDSTITPLCRARSKRKSASWTRSSASATLPVIR